MKFQSRMWGLAGAAALAVAVPAGTSWAQSVEDGFKAWDSGRHDEAVRLWRTLADRGNHDAQFALGHAYRLGRGVPQNLNLSEQWYERAARGGHQEAQAMYGVILFQNGRRQEALPYIRRGAENGDPRAQYVLGTVLFNGDYLPADHPRAFALMTRAAAQGLPQAESHLRQMNQHVSEADRARGLELARAMADRVPARLAEGGPAPIPAATPPRAAPSAVPARPIVRAPAPVPAPAPARTVAPSPARTATPAPAQPRARPDQQSPARLAVAGRWRIQLGAFGNEANARRAWEAARARLPGLQPFYVRAGALTRLQAGPLSDRAAADRSCASVRAGGGACLVVAP